MARNLFRVVVGSHVELGPPNCECERCVEDRRWAELHKENPDRYPERIMGHIYNAGDIVDSSMNLAKLNQDGAIKFEPVNESGETMRPKPVKPKIPPPRQPQTDSMDLALGDGLQDMTVNDLKALAEEEEIELGAASRKEDIIRAIRAAQAAASARAGFNS